MEKHIKYFGDFDNWETILHSQKEFTSDKCKSSYVQR